MIESLVPTLKMSSIDEAFADLTDISGLLKQLGREIRAEILLSAGIPTDVGMPPSKRCLRWLTMWLNACIGKQQPN